MERNKQNYKSISQDQRISEAVQKILNLFESGNIPETIALLTNPKENTPSSSWSLRNKLIAFANGTLDARGFFSWKEAGRQIKANSKAFYILAPLIVKDEEDSKEILSKVVGFRPIPVFKVEDTQGRPLENENIPLPNFRFLDVAKHWGLEVKTTSFNSSVYGSYIPSKKTILIASPEEEVFFHELAHAGHDRTGFLNIRTKEQREIIAEFASAVLIYLSSKKTNRIGNAYEYLKSYCKGQNVNKAVLNLISDIEKILKLIIETEKKIEKEESLISSD